MKFKIITQKTPLYSAVENDFIDIVKLLVKDERVDANIKSIFNCDLNTINNLLFLISF